MYLMEANNVAETYVPHQVLKHYDELTKSRIRKNWQDLDEDEIWKELCFCILSANVSYDLVKSVMYTMTKKNLLNHKWIIQERKSKTIIYKEFNQSQFLPKKKNGGLRKYRYPKKRAFQIVDAARFFYINNGSIKKFLYDAKSDIDARNFLVENISGLGIKESSHFLRNIGYSTSLAIIDVHVLAFLKRASLVKMNKKISLTTKIYLLLERILRNFAKFHKLTLSILDVALWHYMRNYMV